MLRSNSVQCRTPMRAEQKIQEGAREPPGPSDDGVVATAAMRSRDTTVAPFTESPRSHSQRGSTTGTHAVKEVDQNAPIGAGRNGTIRSSSHWLIDAADQRRETMGVCRRQRIVEQAG